MEGHRFDRFTRSVASGQSRRSMLKGPEWLKSHNRRTGTAGNSIKSDA